MRGTSLAISDATPVATGYLDSDCEMDKGSELDTNSASDITQDNNALPACAVCNGRHAATKCRTLRRLGLKDRMEKVRTLNLCFCCLKPGHVSSRCLEHIRCKVVGCQRHHATLLHGASWPSGSNSTNTSGTGRSHNRLVQAGAAQSIGTPPPSSPVDQSRGPAAEGEAVMCSGHVVKGKVQKVALPIVAVKVKAPGSDCSVDTYALLDTGASRSFCTKEVLDALRIEGRTENVAISTLLGSIDCAARTADLQVSGMCGREGLLLGDVHACDSLPALMGHVGTEVDTARWPHLHGLSLPQARADQIGLIIGQDNSEALAPLSSIFGQRGEPYAVRTRLGWSLHGPLVRRAKEPSACLAVADCGNSELAVRQAKVLEQGTQRPVRLNSDRRQRPSPSAGLKRSSGRRSKRRGRKELSVSSSRVVPVSLPITLGQSTASSKAEPANRRWLRSAAKRLSTDSLYRENCDDSKPLTVLHVSQNGDCVVKGRKRNHGSSGFCCRSDGFHSAKQHKSSRRVTACGGKQIEGDAARTDRRVAS